MPNWAELKPLEWVEIPENCNWKFLVKNYSECYHCSLNHPTFSNGVVKPETYDIQSGFDHQNEYSSWFLWPMFSFQVYPGNLLDTYHWRAVDANHVVVWRAWYSVGGEDNETVRKLAQHECARRLVLSGQSP
ncbi:SRPBCC family protein [Roseovarius pelagicus]|uniref:SRPBCC family protein n=1 Tax=Roseovarius pelagicus TaxID=2980108 RepID=UPI0027E46191|nr:SRPBCC family protein [Roseovarius pelagicus]